MGDDLKSSILAKTKRFICWEIPLGVFHIQEIKKKDYTQINEV